MCIRKKDNRREKRDEFRTCFSSRIKNHPTYIYEKRGDNYHFIGITHSPITRNTRNIELEQNPNPNDKSKAYIKPTSEQAKTSLFSKKKKEGWNFNKADKKKVKQVIKNSKKNKSRAANKSATRQ